MADASAELLATLREIRTWVRAAAYPSVKKLLEDALPDTKSRQAYQMTDGANARDSICKACKLSPNRLLALQSRCVALGLMSSSDGRKTRLFDLCDFGLLGNPKGSEEQPDGATDGKRIARLKR